MRNDPRELTARFDSKCDESGEPIRRGDQIIYWPSRPKAKVYKIGSAPKHEHEETSDLREALAENFRDGEISIEEIELAQP